MNALTMRAEFEQRLLSLRAHWFLGLRRVYEAVGRKDRAKNAANEAIKSLQDLETSYDQMGRYDRLVSVKKRAGRAAAYSGVGRKEEEKGSCLLGRMRSECKGGVTRASFRITEDGVIIAEVAAPDSSGKEEGKEEKARRFVDHITTACRYHIGMTEEHTAYILKYFGAPILADFIGVFTPDPEGGRKFCKIDEIDGAVDVIKVAFDTRAKTVTMKYETTRKTYVIDPETATEDPKDTPHLGDDVSYRIKTRVVFNQQGERQDFAMKVTRL